MRRQSVMIFHRERPDQTDQRIQTKAELSRVYFIHIVSCCMSKLETCQGQIDDHRRCCGYRG